MNSRGYAQPTPVPRGHLARVQARALAQQGRAALGSKPDLPRGFVIAVGVAWTGLMCGWLAPLYVYLPEAIGWLRKLVEEVSK